MDLKDIEIFKTGIHTSSSGQTAAYTRADLERIAGTYAPAEYEAPNVIGHPAANAPAFGWVERLRVAGDRLLADLKQVPQEFVEMIRDGRFKKRSISLKRDGSLRHVGWLGAAAPAVEGLKDVTFAGGESALEYSFENAGEVPHNLEDEEMKTELEKLKAELAAMRTDLAQIKDTQVASAFQARLTAMEGLVSELATRTKAAEDEATKAKAEKDKAVAEFAAYKGDQVKAGREARFKALVDAGKALPGDKDKVLNFAASLALATATMDFAAPGGKTEQVSQEEAYWRDLEARNPHGLFQDFKAPDGDGGGKPLPSLTHKA